MLDDAFGPYQIEKRFNNVALRHNQKFNRFSEKYGFLTPVFI